MFVYLLQTTIDLQLLVQQLRPRSWTRNSTSAGYAPLRFRSALVPLANIGSSLSYIVIMLGIVLTAFGSVFGSTALWIGAGLMSLAVLFSIVTLPVEFNASSRAMKQITALNIVNEKEYKHAKKVLSLRNDLCSFYSSSIS